MILIAQVEAVFGVLLGVILALILYVGCAGAMLRGQRSPILLLGMILTGGFMIATLGPLVGQRSIWLKYALVLATIIIAGHSARTAPTPPSRTEELGTHAPPDPS